MLSNSFTENRLNSMETDNLNDKGDHRDNAPKMTNFLDKVTLL